MTVLDELRNSWLSAGVIAKQGANKEALERFESNHRIQLPAAFREYLLTTNGMEEGQTDANLISFLSLEVIERPENHKDLSPDWFQLVFAEYCVWSHVYVLGFSRVADKSYVLATDGKHGTELAASFQAFLIKYLCDPSGVAHCWPSESSRQP